MNRLFLLTAATVLAGVSAQAADQALLDTLVKKGTLTQAEADAIVAAKPAPAPVAATAKDTVAQKITVSGFVQARYTFIDQNEKGTGVADPADTNGFTARRITLNFEAAIKDGWSIFISPEMDGAPNGGSGTTNSATFYLDKAGVQYASSAGKAVVGLKKVNFGLEEYGSAITALAVERSVASMFLATNNLASRHTGIFWDSESKNGFSYGAAVTNAAVNSAAPTTANNEFAVWGNVAYEFTCPVTKGKAKAGLNTGYIGENDAIGYRANIGSAFGYNPYLTLSKDKFTGTAEIIGWEVNGINNNTDAKPFGYNLTAAYKVTEEIEPVVRFSQLKTDGLGVANDKAIYGGTGVAGRTYDDVTSIYLGVNYYIQGNNLKVQAGYEYSQLTDSTARGSQIDANAFRVQLQAAF